MKKHILTSLMILGLFVIAARSGFAQSGMLLKVSIPFEFSVGERTLPAGEYVVKQIATGVLTIQDVNCTTTQTFLTNSTQTGKRRDVSALMFHRYDDRYFLSQIWTAGNDIGHELQRPHAERELIRARSASAKAGAPSLVVSIGARHE